MIKAISVGARAKDKTIEHSIEIFVEFNEPCTQREAEKIIMDAISDVLLRKPGEVQNG